MQAEIFECRKVTVAGVAQYIFLFEVREQLTAREYAIVVRATELGDNDTLQLAKEAAILKLSTALAHSAIDETPVLSEALGHVHVGPLPQ